MSIFHITTDSLLFECSSNILRWVACARGEFSCDQCGKTFPVGAKLRDHIKDYHEVSWTSIGTYIAHKLIKYKIIVSQRMTNHTVGTRLSTMAWR